MRILLMAMLLLGGCQKSFDERFADTEKQLKADAERLDREMAAEARKEPGEDVQGAKR